jgi:aquaporin Z
LFAELFGTFLLVLVAAGGGMTGRAFPDTISRTAAVVAPGLMVLAIILFMGKVSGAHLNPAVSVAFSLRGDFPWRRVPGYVLVQLAGRPWPPGSSRASSMSRRPTARPTRRRAPRPWTRS